MSFALGCAVACVLVMTATPAMADDLITGSLRGGYWSSDRELDGNSSFVPGSIWLKSTPDFGNGFHADAEGWAMDEPVHQDGGHTKADVRDFYLGWRNDTVEISLGRRVMPWGRADGYNPTDFLSNHDYTLLFPNDDDQRRGTTVGAVSYAFGDTTATFVWNPEFRPNIFPIPHLPGILVRQGTDRLDLSQFAARVDRTAGGIDWALTYFNGVDRDPGARLVSGGPSGGVIEAIYNRVQSFGADFATNLGGYGLRGEAAYTRPQSNDANLFNPHPFAAMVLGVDHDLTGNLNIEVQYIVHYTFSFQNPANGPGPLAPTVSEAALINNQRRRLEDGPSLHIRYKAFNETLLLELSATAFLSDGGYAVRPKLTYDITDQLRLILGADLYEGHADSFFGQLHHNTTVYAELQYAY
jgi:hypothetical protein